MGDIIFPFLFIRKDFINLQLSVLLAPPMYVFRWMHFLSQDSFFFCVIFFLTFACAALYSILSTSLSVLKYLLYVLLSFIFYIFSMSGSHQYGFALLFMSLWPRASKAASCILSFMWLYNSSVFPKKLFVLSFSFSLF
jgi:hypothetical protein